MEHSIVHVLCALVGLLIVASSLRPAKSDPATGAKVLQFGVVLRLFAILGGLVVPAASIALLVSTFWQQALQGRGVDPSDYLITAALVLGFVMIGAFVLLYSFWTRILLLEE